MNGRAIDIPPARMRLPAALVVRAFGLIIVFLAVAHVATQSIRYHAGKVEAYGSVRLFNLGAEANLPTTFSAFQMLIAAIVLGVIGLSRRQQADPRAGQWLMLAAMFLLLSVDELSELHELTTRPMWELVPWLTHGLFFWAWVLPAMGLVVVVAWRYAGFVFNYLPPETRRSTILGAALFVGGAIGVEMPEARHVEQHGIDNFTYGMFVLVEEVLEMVGVLVFLSGIMKYASRHVGVVEFDVHEVYAESAASERRNLRPAAAGMGTDQPTFVERRSRPRPLSMPESSRVS